MLVKDFVDLQTTSDILWSYLIRIDKIKQWNQLIVKAQDLMEDRLEVGYTCSLLIDEKIGKTWYKAKLVEYKMPHILSFKLTGGNLGSKPLINTYRIESTSVNSCRLYFEAKWKADSFTLKMAEPIIQAYTQKTIGKSLELLQLIFL